MTDELWERIRQLERVNQLWKRLSVSLMIGLALLVLVAGTLGMLSIRQVTAERQRAEAQRHEAEQMLRKAKQAVDEQKKKVQP